MSKKHTNTCNDCIHYDICYKIEHFGRDLETNIPCKEFIGVNDRVEVVRCKDCKYFNHKELECQCDGIVQDLADSGSFRLNFYLDDYCSYGIRKENDNA